MTNSDQSLVDSLEFEVSESDTRELGFFGVPYPLPDQSRMLARLKRAIRRPKIHVPVVNVVCPFCDVHMVKRRVNLRDGDEDDADWLSGAMEWCERCTFWRWQVLETCVYGSRGLMAMHTYRSRASKLAAFDPNLPEGCAAELATHLRRDPTGWRTMNPRRLETFVGEIFRSNFEAVEVRHVGGTNDGGIDLVWVGNDNTRWLLQVKRRESATQGEGVGTIRSLLGTMLLDGARHGAVVSTACHFTYMAHRAVGRAEEVGFVVRLIDQAALDRLLDPLLPREPWKNMLEVDFPLYAPHFASREKPGIDASQRELFPDSERTFR